MPARAPTKVVAPISRAAVRATCWGVAPMRRSVAKRSARCAAPRSVTIPTSSSAGTSTAMAPTIVAIRYASFS